MGARIEFHLGPVGEHYGEHLSMGDVEFVEQGFLGIAWIVFQGIAFLDGYHLSGRKNYVLFFVLFNGLYIISYLQDYHILLYRDRIGGKGPLKGDSQGNQPD